MKAVFGIILLFIFWTLLSFWVGDYFVPYPWQTLFDFVDLFISDDAFYHLGLTILRVLIGFVFAVFSGFIFGWFVGRNPVLSKLSRPMILFFQGMPPILWTIPLLLIMGVGFFTPVVVIALITFPLIVVNISEGVKTIPVSLEEMVALFAPGFLPRLREVYFPHLKPFITAALELGIVLALKASTVAEFFGASDGIGAKINGSYQAFKMHALFAWGFLVIVLILLFHALGSWIKKQAVNMKGFHRGFYFPFQSKRHEKQSSYVGIEVNGLDFAYHNGDKILNNIQFKLGGKEMALLSGDSGKGKTTLVHLLSGLIKSSQANIRIPRKRGVVFQDDRFLPWRDVLYNAALPVIYGAYGQGGQRAMDNVRTWLKKCGLEDYSGYFPAELSGGMKKRLALARCLSFEPEVLLLDEPFVGLDKRSRIEIWKLIKDYYDENNVAILIVTHHPEDIPFLSECRILELKDRTINEKKSRLSQPALNVK
ncbi:MAG: ATP-binding cassette domain-containing protein [Spirochaetales bacterium]|nr:ATP-binding cassette domain-containing protein [Spirochaetales bacterium]